MNEAELAAQYQAGDRGALRVIFERHALFARAKACSYFVMGPGPFDATEAAKKALVQAAHAFRADQQSSFRSLVELCVTKQVIEAVRTATWR